jgi:hypothetical protein
MDRTLPDAKEAVAPRITPNGGMIAQGHPLGTPRARLAGTAALKLALSGGNDPCRCCASVWAKDSPSPWKGCDGRYGRWKEPHSKGGTTNG